MSNLCRTVFTSSKRACLIVAGVAFLAISGTGMPSASASTPAPVSGDHHHPMPSGIAYLPAIVNLQPTLSGTWVKTGLQVTLPGAGTYALDVNVRSVLAATPPSNPYMVARLWNLTSGTAVPRSERILNQVYDLTPAGAGPIGQNVTTPISELITVAGPTTIQLQARRINAPGASGSTRAEIYSDGNGRTSFRYSRIA
jgi:hypothetical protein